jgi:hypothetical protein
MVPLFIIINGCKINVVLVSHLYRDYECYGMYSSMKMQIELDSSMSEQKQELIFCHEMMEAIKDIYLLELEETEIQAIAATLYDIFKNKKVNFDGV